VRRIKRPKIEKKIPAILRDLSWARSRRRPKQAEQRPILKKIYLILYFIVTYGLIRKRFMSNTLYLKYRPQKAGELHLTEVRKSLEKILESEKIPHAWLFSGPRGTGKTSSARILAKAVNCLHYAKASRSKDEFEPCNECEMCKEITAGTAVDIVEIDAASNRGIDEIRNLREKIKLAPMRAKYKVYIIDEVHMLTTEAANALLKTLEEPPEKTLFILCTTEADKIPETVVSRCTRIRFTKPTLEEAVASLEKVVEGEKLKPEKGVLEMIAKAARGSFRDGTKILEQIAMDNSEITLDAVGKAIGVITAADPEKFITALNFGKTKECLETIAELDRQGINLRRFAEILAETLRGKLLEVIMTNNTGKEQVIKLIEGLDRAYEQMKTAAVVQLPLEIWVIESTPPGVHRDSLEPGKPQIEIPHPPTPSPNLVEGEPEVKSDIPSGKGKYSLTDLTAKWQEIMKAVKPKNHSVEALLRSTKPISFDGEKLELEVFYKFHKDKLETEKCRQIVEMAVMEVFSVGMAKLNLKLGQKPSSAKATEGRGGDLSGKVEEDIVKAAEEIFRADAV
jgi:DNA polymerase III subunit gamma/tau